MNRSLRIGAGRASGTVAVALVAMTLAAVPSFAAVTPAQGPTAGGTSVSVGYPALQVASLSGGFEHTVALTTQGDLYAWGAGGSGQLGNGDTSDSSTPTLVDTSGVLDGVTITQVTAGISSDFTLALSSDGQVYAWGSNANGQLGDGTTDSSDVPVAVDTSGAMAGKNIIQIAAGEGTSYALADDGTVYAWGAARIGELGNGTTVASSVPVAVDMTGVLAGKEVTQIGSGTSTAIVLTSDGGVYTWGYNGYGALGDGTGTSIDSISPVPVAVDMTGVLAGETVVQVAAGVNLGVRTAAGHVYTWGLNRYGALGDGSSSDYSAVPVAVDTSGVLAGAEVTQLVGGGNFFLALTSDGTVVGWGDNSRGQLGTAAPSGSSTPVTVVGAGTLGAVTQLNVGALHSLLVLDDGTAYGLGDNSAGQLGDGTTDSTSTPVQVAFPLEEVYFDGIAATLVERADSNTLVAVTPAHAAGVVDVTVLQASRTTTLAAAYTYGSAPEIISGPVAQTTTTAGASVTLAVSGTGDEAPTVTWQQYDADTDTWVTLSDSGTSAVDGENVVGSLEVIAPAEGSTVLYRAVLTNTLGEAVSAQAAVVVPGPEVPPVTPTPTPSATGSSDTGSSDTGSSDTGTTATGESSGTDTLATTGATGLIIGGLALALLIAGGVFVLARRARI